MKQSCTERLTGAFKRGHQALTAQPAGSDGPAGFLCEPWVPALAPCPANPNLCHNIPDRRTTPTAVFAQLRWLCISVSNPLVSAPWLFSPSSSVWFLFFQLFVAFFLFSVWLSQRTSDVFHKIDGRSRGGGEAATCGSLMSPAT